MDKMPKTIRGILSSIFSKDMAQIIHCKGRVIYLLLQTDKRTIFPINEFLINIIILKEKRSFT